MQLYLYVHDLISDIVQVCLAEQRLVSSPEEWLDSLWPALGFNADYSVIDIAVLISLLERQLKQLAQQEAQRAAYGAPRAASS